MRLNSLPNSSIATESRIAIPTELKRWYIINYIRKNSLLKFRAIHSFRGTFSCSVLQQVNQTWVVLARQLFGYSFQQDFPLPTFTSVV